MRFAGRVLPASPSTHHRRLWVEEDAIKERRVHEYAIEMRGITKTFPGVIANDKVNLSVKNQEIHALLGENGAGKSTLMSILFGAYSADSGTILINGEEVEIKNPNVATALGIGMVHGTSNWFKTTPSPRISSWAWNRGAVKSST